MENKAPKLEVKPVFRVCASGLYMMVVLVAAVALLLFSLSVLNLVLFFGIREELLASITNFLSAAGAFLGGFAGCGALYFAWSWRRQYLHKETHSDLLRLKDATRDWYLSMSKLWAALMRLPKPQKRSHENYGAVHIRGEQLVEFCSVTDLAKTLDEKYEVIRKANVRLMQSGYRQHEGLLKDLSGAHSQITALQSTFCKCVILDKDLGGRDGIRIGDIISNRGVSQTDWENLERFLGPTDIGREAMEAFAIVNGIANLKSPLVPA